MPYRGDCYRASGAAEMAVCDYKRALEVEPGNWMVKTRLSLAHYLKVRDCGWSLFMTRRRAVVSVIYIFYPPADRLKRNGLALVTPP